MSNHAAGSVTPTVGGGAGEKILDYPYAFDQDQKHEVDFQEKLYRANNEVQRASQDLYRANEDMQSRAHDVLFPSVSQQIGGLSGFPGARDLAQAICDMAEIEG